MKSEITEVGRTLLSVRASGAIFFVPAIRLSDGRELTFWLRRTPVSWFESPSQDSVDRILSLFPLDELVARAAAISAHDLCLTIIPSE